MDFNNNVENSFEPTNATVNNDHIIVEVSKVPNLVLQRLMEEVKNDQANDMFAYDRAHNRHNRS